jgi:hypothetical protein
MAKLMGIGESQFSEIMNKKGQWMSLFLRPRDRLGIGGFKWKQLVGFVW